MRMHGLHLISALFGLSSQSTRMFSDSEMYRTGWDFSSVISSHPKQSENKLNKISQKKRRLYARRLGKIH